jgi:hypothetical protein
MASENPHFHKLKKVGYEIEIIRKKLVKSTYKNHNVDFSNPRIIIKTVNRSDL